jgi:hypothetical protein
MRLLLTTFLSAFLFLVACKNKTEDTSTGSSETATAPTTVTAPVTDQPTVIPNTQVITPPPTKTDPPQNAQGIWHFTCPKGCKGGGGAAGPCAKCGATLAHNQAYHGGATPVSPPNGIQTIPTTASGTPPPPTKSEPAQNAKGVWHFTCPKGCAGGAGAAAPCGKCGTTLAHNAGYH